MMAERLAAELLEKTRLVAECLVMAGIETEQLETLEKVTIEHSEMGLSQMGLSSQAA